MAAYLRASISFITYSNRGSMRKQSGNALWFILLAIALLGLLTVLLTRTSATTEETGDNERMTLAVSQLMRFTASVQSTVQNMLMRGVSESELSFANTLYQLCDGTAMQDDGHNPNCTKPDCEIFGMYGGALNPVKVPDSLVEQETCSGSDWKKGNIALNSKRVMGLGSDDNDELTLEVYGLTQQACLKINSMLGIDPVSGDAPVDNSSGGSLFSGTLGTYGPQIGDESTSTGLIGKKAFCKKDGSAYSFFTVLIVK